MEYLVAKGYRLTITSLKCGHSYLTASGNVSAHSYGSAVDIAAVNGIPITGHQGPGTITEAVIKDLLLLQGTMRPAQIISLMDLGPPTFILPDHYNHIHVGYTFTTAGSSIKQLGQILKPEQWQRLIQRLGADPEPEGAVEAVRRRAAGQGRQRRRRLAGAPRPHAQARDNPSQLRPARAGRQDRPAGGALPGPRGRRRAGPDRAGARRAAAAAARPPPRAGRSSRARPSRSR